MNCKPGDLAIVVRSRHNPECVGMLCTVLEIVESFGIRTSDDGYDHYNGDGAAYFCKSEGAPFPPGPYDVGFCMWSMWAPECLRPIRPGDLEDETPTVRELETQ